MNALSGYDDKADRGKNTGERKSAKRGKGLKLRDFRQVVDLFDEFTLELTAANYLSLPTKLNFIRWLAETKGIRYPSRAVFYERLNEILHADANQEAVFRDMLASVLAEGAALKKYQQTIVGVCLRNWCGWTDKGASGGEGAPVEIEVRLREPPVAEAAEAEEGTEAEGDGE